MTITNIAFTNRYRILLIIACNIENWKYLFTRYLTISDIEFYMKLDSKILKLAADSSNAAREQLAEVTAEQFLAQAREFSEVEIGLFNDIFCKLYEFASHDIKTRVSATFATSTWAPDELLGKMAKDELHFAAPILTHSEVISEKSLLEVIEETGTRHQTLIAGRKNIGEPITDALIAKENTEVASVLSGNLTAKISENSFAKLVETTKNDITASNNLKKRTDLPAEIKLKLAQNLNSNVSETEQSGISAKEKNLPTQPIEQEFIDYSKEPIIETPEQKELMSIINSGNENRFLVYVAKRLEVTSQKLLNFISSNSAQNYGILVRALDLRPETATKVFGLFNRTKILDQRDFNKVVNNVFSKMRSSDAIEKFKILAK